jgi:hypothetical protein
MAMIKILLCSVALACAPAFGSSAFAQSAASAQAPRIQIADEDIARFWTAYDAVRMETDPVRQAALFQQLYVEPGAPGLRAFMTAKGYTVESYLNVIRSYPRFWDSIRPRTALASQGLVGLEDHLDRFRRLYPELRPAVIYFEIGALRSGGTTLDDKVLIGVEMVTGDQSVDISDMPPRLQAFMAGYLATQPLESLDLVIVHEVVHTQQKGERRTLLAQVVYEGVADFVAEQVTGRLPNLPYVAYGPANDAAIRAAFQRDMAGDDFSDWLYNNTDNPFGTRDLGYYVGYAIASRYHARAADKRAAVRAMIELDYSDQAAVDRFVRESGYFAD